MLKKLYPYRKLPEGFSHPPMLFPLLRGQSYKKIPTFAYTFNIKLYKNRLWANL